jgi:hypothetical protein
LDVKSNQPVNKKRYKRLKVGQLKVDRERREGIEIQGTAVMYPWPFTGHH